MPAFKADSVNPFTLKSRRYRARHDKQAARFNDRALAEQVRAAERQAVVPGLAGLPSPSSVAHPAVIPAARGVPVMPAASSSPGKRPTRPIEIEPPRLALIGLEVVYWPTGRVRGCYRHFRDQRGWRWVCQDPRIRLGHPEIRGTRAPRAPTPSCQSPPSTARISRLPGRPDSHG